MVKDRPTAGDIEAAEAAIALGWEPHPGALVWARVQNFGHEALPFTTGATRSYRARPRWSTIRDGSLRAGGFRLRCST